MVATAIPSITSHSLSRSLEICPIVCIIISIQVETLEVLISMGEFLLPYEAVRTAADPKAALLDFLASTYEAAADAAGWDRKALECGLGRPGTPRAV